MNQWKYILGAIIYVIVIVWAQTLHNHSHNHKSIEYPQPLHAKLLFTGDLMQHMPQVNAARNAANHGANHGAKFNYDPVFSYVKPYFKAAHCVFVNLETTITEKGNYSGYPHFRSPVELVESMDRAGVDIALLANNHSCDNGAYGINTTHSTLDKHGIQYTGVFRDSLELKNKNPLHITINGIKFALFNYTYGTNGIKPPKGYIVNLIDTAIMKKDIASVDRDKSDCIIACIHWGSEYQRQANREQIELARLLSRCGVDIIIGSHPHVIQQHEADSSGVVVYSLGNFVSNQRKRYTDGGAMATIDVFKQASGDMSYKTEITHIWVQLPDYKILPQQVGDTMKMSPTDRYLYQRFINDTKEFL